MSDRPQIPSRTETDYVTREFYHQADALSVRQPAEDIITDDDLIEFVRTRRSLGASVLHRRVQEPHVESDPLANTSSDEPPESSHDAQSDLDATPSEETDPASPSTPSDAGGRGPTDPPEKGPPPTPGYPDEPGGDDPEHEKVPVQVNSPAPSDRVEESQIESGDEDVVEEVNSIADEQPSTVISKTNDTANDPKTADDTMPLGTEAAQNLSPGVGYEGTPAGSVATAEVQSDTVDERPGDDPEHVASKKADWGHGELAPTIRTYAAALGSKGIDVKKIVLGEEGAENFRPDTKGEAIARALLTEDEVTTNKLAARHETPREYVSHIGRRVLDSLMDAAPQDIADQLPKPQPKTYEHSTGQMMRKALRDRGLTLDEGSRLSGISRSGLARAVTNKRLPHREAFTGFLDGLEITSEEREQLTEQYERDLAQTTVGKSHLRKPADPDKLSTGDMLRALITGNQRTAREVARAAGLSESNMYKITGNVVVPNRQTLRKLLDVLNPPKEERAKIWKQHKQDREPSQQHKYKPYTLEAYKGEPTDTESPGYQLNQLRTKKGLTREELGRAARYNPNYLGRIFANTIPPTPGTLVRILRAMGATKEESERMRSLFFGE